MMKYKILTACLIVLVALPAFALRSDRDNTSPRTAASIDFGTWINANKILMFVTNKGSFAYDNGTYFGKADGLYYPYTSIDKIEDGSNTTTAIYAGSVWMGAIDAATGDTLVTSGQHDTDWGIGPIIGGAPPSDPVANLSYRVYVLYSDSLADNPNQDYLEWPIEHGAPFVVTDEGDTIPEMFGDQMLWSVCNDIDPTYHIGNAGTVGEGLGIEMRMTTFAFAREGALSNIVFAKFQLYNKGGKDLTDMYVSLWADPDLGDASDDYVGCDTALSLGYCYNAGPMDTDYGSMPPACGYDFFQGPLFPGTDADTARMWGALWPGYTNMGMTSYNKYVNPYGPDVARESYRFMTGLTKDGSPLVDGNGDTTVYFGWGDPVTGTGFLDDDPSDRRWMQSTGPFDFATGDSTEILCAIIVAQGSDYLNSVTQLKAVDAFAQKVYENNFQLPAPPASPDVTVSELDREIVLSWGFASQNEPGGYPFEGYAVLQGETTLGPWDTLAWYDLPNDITGVADYLADPSIFPNSVPVMLKPGTNNGLAHTFSVTRDVISGGPLSNHTEYIFKIEAYSVDLTAPATEVTLTSGTVVTAIPQMTPIGTELVAEAGDTLVVNQVGTSDGTVRVRVIDPASLTGDGYTVEFSTDPTLGPVWHLLDGDGNTILANQTNQGAEGAENYAVVEGIQVVVTGPPPGVKPGDMFESDDVTTWGWDIPAGTRRFTWAEADGFGWEGFRGAIGWGGPGDVNGFGTADPVDPALLPNVLLKLATATTAGVFDPNDENVSYAYRYLRGPGPPARPEFAPFIVDPDPPGGSYGFQDFEKSCPLSAWNVDVDPPQRLALGYLENNAALATLDGKYFPAESDSLAAWGTDNIDGGGPREWLWIYLDDYSETPNPAYQLNAIDDPAPVMYWLTVARRGHDVPFSPDSSGQDQFIIYPNKVNSAAVTFSFTTAGFEPVVAATGNAAMLENIKAVPNPYYLFSDYDASTYNRTMKFTNLPEKCTIKIYNLAGDQIIKLYKEDDLTYTEWNLLNNSSIPIASGIYIYVVEAEGYGQKIGKMAIFTETEVLDQY